MLPLELQRRRPSSAEPLITRVLFSQSVCSAGRFMFGTACVALVRSELKTDLSHVSAFVRLVPKPDM